jgi:multidrug efflux pump subunit AcrA (membrane-fusion protein)
MEWYTSSCQARRRPDLRPNQRLPREVVFRCRDKVKAGEVLAEIDTPEVDRILAQAKAILAQAEAQLKVAQAARDSAEVTYKRYQNLFKGKVISAQDFDTAADIYGGNQAVVTAEQSNVDGLEALEAFKIIRAPFDGTIAARNTDIGAYVLAGSGAPLFRMAATSRLRVTSPFHKRFLR